MSSSIKQLAVEAIEVQDSCNPLGLTKGFAKAVQELHETLQAEQLPSDTQALCNHPITRLWASKLHDITNMGPSEFDRFHEAYEACKRLAGVESLSVE